MITTEIINDRLKRTYSNTGHFIHKLGTDELYSEAVDLIGSTYQYVETDEKIEEQQEK